MGVCESVTSRLQLPHCHCQGSGCHHWANHVWPPASGVCLCYSANSPGEQKLWSDIKTRGSLILLMTKSQLHSTHVISGTRRQSYQFEARAQHLRFLSGLTAELRAGPGLLCAVPTGLRPVPRDSPCQRVNAAEKTRKNQPVCALPPPCPENGRRRKGGQL